MIACWRPHQTAISFSASNRRCLTWRLQSMAIISLRTHPCISSSLISRGGRQTDPFLRAGLWSMRWDGNRLKSQWWQAEIPIWWESFCRSCHHNAHISEGILLPSRHVSNAQSQWRILCSGGKTMVCCCQYFWWFLSEDRAWVIWRNAVFTT